VDVVAGNSSSGLYEAPSFGIPTVDIGDRQRGRIAASSVLHCEPERSAIANSLKAALGVGRQAVVNPYGDGEASRRIVRILRGLPPTEVLLRKPFFSLGGVHA
jgi:UDP-N-acetylglucosamine 2-epimerase (non-hydrolysing)/GDP/UDP-N,N'-diacetylbacillosamine 2-epimerase (hydrolysing)